VSAVRKLPDDVVTDYVDMLRGDEHALRGSFGWYRALDTFTAQNEQRKARRLAMPAVAIGAEYNSRNTVGATMGLAADDVRTAVIPGVSDWPAEGA
jgi:hypothetical protein